MSMKKSFLSLLLILSLLLCGCSLEYVPAPAVPAVPTAADTLTVHFIDVGQADCALLECGGQYLLIDGGKRDDSQLVVSYLERCGVQELQAVVCTHAHEDHLGGLPSVLAVYPTATVYSPTKTYSSTIFDDFLRYAGQQRLEVTIPSPGDRFPLGAAEITVLGPVKSYAESNDTSIVLMVEFGENRFLFTGDAERIAENDMLDYWEGKLDWNVDVLKVGHHGSSTSSGYRFLYETAPEYAIVSCAKGNDYGHPHKEIVQLYHDAGVPLFRTDQLGTILAVSDGQEITLTWEKQHAAPKDMEPAADFGKYIGNKNSKTLHTPFCDGLPKETNRVYYDSYEEAMASGCKPCGGCIG